MKKEERNTSHNAYYVISFYPLFFFHMKKFSSLHKGFTLVELMIVIAIIGILAAVLYPAMTGYFERSRDTNRQKALNNVSLSLVTYYNDNNQYPAKATSPTGCLDDVSTTLLNDNGTSYLKSLTKDPNSTKTLTANTNSITGCFGANKTGYGYKPLDSNGSFALAAIVENRANTNFNAGLSAASTSGAEQGANSKRWTDISSIKDIEPAFSANKNSVVSANKTNLLYVVGQ